MGFGVRNQSLIGLSEFDLVNFEKSSEFWFVFYVQCTCKGTYNIGSEGVFSITSAAVMIVGFVSPT